MRIERFEDIYAWQQARVLVREVYRLCRGDGIRSDFTFRDQICRAAISVMTNIAEGFSRRSRVEFGRFLDISRASAREVQSLLYVALDVGYIDDSAFRRIYDDASNAASTITRLMCSLPN